MNKSTLIAKIKEKLLQNSITPNGHLIEKITFKLANCDTALLINLFEWIESKPFSDIWIREKYCLNAVLKIRGNPTSPLAIADAILALNAYAENVANEHLIWQKRM